MKASEIEMGSLYCYPKNNAAVSVFQDPANDMYSQYVFTIQKGTPFVPLELVSYKTREKNLVRVKVLTATGKIGYMVYPEDSPTFMEPVTA